MRIAMWKMVALACFVAGAGAADARAGEKPDPTLQAPSDPFADFSKAYANALQPSARVECSAVDLIGKANADGASVAAALRVEIERALRGRGLRVLDKESDVVVTIQLRAPRSDNARFSLTLESLSLARSEKIADGQFEWREGVDDQSIRLVAEQVVNGWMNQFTRHYLQTALPYKVQLIGVTDLSKVRLVRDAVTSIPSVKGVGSAEVVDGESKMEVAYFGSPLDLGVALQDTARRVLHMRVNAVVAKAGVITLVAKDPPLFHGNGNGEFIHQDRALSQLRQVYADRKKPSVAIVVRRQEADLGFVSERVEDRTNSGFKAVATQVVEPMAVRAVLKSQAFREQTPFSETELGALVAKRTGAEVIVQVTGQSVAGAQAFGYTFRAFGAAGQLLGEGVYALELAGDRDSDQAVNEMSDRMVGSLMMQLWPPATINVRVVDAKSPDEVLSMRTLFEDSIPGAATLPGVSRQTSDGGWEFTVTYARTFDELTGAIKQLQSKASFDLDVASATRSQLQLKVRHDG